LSGHGLVVARYSAIHGTGVFAARAIRRGTAIVHYLGRLRTHAAVDAAYDARSDDGHTFYFTLNPTFVVDAGSGGNVARWINHSCDPNCETVIEEDPGGNPRRDRILIRALRAIPAGRELGYDYGIALDAPPTAAEKRLWACRCGARNCRGTLLAVKKPRRAKTVNR
jgi:SET domain-containing protein